MSDNISMLKVARFAILAIVLAGLGAILFNRRRAFKWSSIRKTIVGKPRQLILDHFGPPPAVIHANGDYLKSQIWYYPFSTRTRQAIALHFSHGDRVADAQLIRGPK